MLNNSMINLRISLSAFWEEQRAFSIESKECPYADHVRINCQNKMRELLNRVSEKIYQGDFEKSLDIITDLIIDIKQILNEYEELASNEKEKYKCVLHWLRILSALKTIRGLIKEIDMIKREKELKATSPFELPIEMIEELDAHELYKNVILPLSNPVRIQLLIEMYKGYKRFSDFEKRINLEGGHLIYHLRPLIKSGFVIRDKNKNYLLTSKGLNILRTIGYINLKK